MAISSPWVSPPAPMIFGNWLRDERKRRALTQRGLAARSGVSPAMIGRLEKGTVGFSQSMVIRLADALAGPDADEQTRERLRQEAMAASVGIELPDIEDMTRPAEARYVEDNSGMRWRIVMELGETQISSDLARMLAALEYLEPEHPDEGNN